MLETERYWRLIELFNMRQLSHVSCIPGYQATISTTTDWTSSSHATRQMAILRAISQLDSYRALVMHCQCEDCWTVGVML